MSKPKRDLVFLLGATATGKSELAIELARRAPFDVISVDSTLVYRGLDIGTAKPELTLRQQIPHHLIDIREPNEPYSAAEFVRDAERLVEQSWARGRTPLLVGGTMLYFRALRDGLASLPSADPSLRQELQAEAQRLGWPAMHERLSQRDPHAAQRIAPHDAQRIARALEIVLLTGETLQHHWQQQTQHTVAERLRCRVTHLVLGPRDRHELDERLQQRFAAMLTAGLVNEVEGLRARHDIHADLPAIKSVGYRQVWQHLAGRISRDEMTRSAISATRSLAKRQYTWLRQWPYDHWLEEPGAKALAASLQYLRSVAIVTSD